jgi:hypothetical protein
MRGLLTFYAGAFLLLLSCFCYINLHLYHKAAFSLIRFAFLKAINFEY